MNKINLHTVSATLQMVYEMIVHLLYIVYESVITICHTMICSHLIVRTFTLYI